VAFSLRLPPKWETQGWKVKVRDRERVEPPHVTIMRKTTAWRWGLRNGQFLDREPDPKGVPQELVAWVRDRQEMLRDSWNQMYPENPVESDLEPDEI
jgi:hypothetical protein